MAERLVSDAKGMTPDDRINKPLDWITSLVNYVREQIKK
jgi:hypothetical protein